MTCDLRVHRHRAACTADCATNALGGRRQSGKPCSASAGRPPANIMPWIYLQTLGNLADGGCAVVLPLLLVCAAGATAAAAWVCWRDAGAAARRSSASADGDL